MAYETMFKIWIIGLTAIVSLVGVKYTTQRKFSVPGAIIFCFFGWTVVVALSVAGSGTAADWFLQTNTVYWQQSLQHLPGTLGIHGIIALVGPILESVRQSNKLDEIRSNRNTQQTGTRQLFR